MTILLLTGVGLLGIVWIEAMLMGEEPWRPGWG